ncbi:MAG: hypothetical protein EON58_07530 [Alphaproteobacteria bacterium]|nr:MAG: hypothetical protein EON58_07530 [Alphaproteobacteria bacterium]
MGATKAGAASKTKAQEVCIDLPGQFVQCWRSSDKVKVVLRKHRDVIFDINLTKDATYTVESKSEFYSPRERKLLKKVNFFDGERLHLWVGREFKDCLVLSANGVVIGKYEVNRLDAARYGSDPKEKPEPLMIVMGSKDQNLMCTSADPLGAGKTQLSIFSTINPKLPLLKSLGGTHFDYSYSPDPPEIREYAAVVDVEPDEIRPEILEQLERQSVTGSPSQLLKPVTKQDADSLLCRALLMTATAIAGADWVNSSWFKETAGYVQENLKALDKISMTIRIEKKAKGKYVAVLKGKPVSMLVAESIGGAKVSKGIHRSAALGSKASQFVDGGFSRTGKAGYGGARRIMLTAAENFKGGLKIQIVGTVIDLFLDAHSVYIDEKGSKDLSEFLGRAGVSLVKAGMTAALGSVLAAGGVAGVTALAVAAGFAAAPAAAVVLVVIGGLILAAMAVDYIDDTFKIKQSVAGLAR